MSGEMQQSILIVDDNAQNLQVLAGMLRSRDYRIAIVQDGQKALKFVDRKMPDLILLDIMLPGMDGYDVCRKLKENERTCDIPVIFISALNEVLDKVKSFSVGGVDYITKPFQGEEVLARVRTHLALRRLQVRLEEQNARLQKALEEVRTLRGILPICASCKKIRDDEGYWKQLESYFLKNSDIKFSHSVCPDCLKKLYPDLADRVLQK